jgi:hypothetical protein
VVYIALHRAVLDDEDRVARLAELLIPVEAAKQAGLSADELLSYISANLTAAVFQAEVEDVKAIVCFLYGITHPPHQGSKPSKDDPSALEQGEIPFQDACCQTDGTGFDDIPRLSVEEEAKVFLSDILNLEPLNICTPVKTNKPASPKVKKPKRSVSSHPKGDLKRYTRKVKSVALRAELKEFAKEHHNTLYLALDYDNVAWLNHHAQMNYMVLREALLLYQHRMSCDNVKYPKKMLSYYLSKVVRR